MPGIFKGENADLHLQWGTYLSEQILIKIEAQKCENVWFFNIEG